MNISNIPIRSNGQRIIASWFNVLRTALISVVDTEIVSTETISAAGKISHSDKVRQIRKVVGDSGNVTASTTPFGTDDTDFLDGMEITLIGTDDTNYVVIEPNDIQYGVVSPVGNAVLQEHFCVTYIYDATAERFIEKTRNS